MSLAIVFRRQRGDRGASNLEKEFESFSLADVNVLVGQQGYQPRRSCLHPTEDGAVYGALLAGRRATAEGSLLRFGCLSRGGKGGLRDIVEA